MSVTAALLVAAALSAIVHLVAEYRGPRALAYVAKPLTTVLLVIVATLGDGADSRYRMLIVAGLVCSLAGDVFLMLPGDRFIAGLVSFLFAHVFYIIAFTQGAAFGARPLLGVPFFIAAEIVLAFLWPQLGKLRVPVIVYVVALVAMAWQASVRAAVVGGTPALLAAIGAALFVVSDATLAVDRFRGKFHLAQAVIMTTYVAAQMLIAMST